MLFIIGVLIGAAVLLFMMQNVEAVSVTFLSWELDGSIAFIVLIAVIAGMLISALLSIPAAIRSGLEVSRLKKHARKLEDDLHSHKKELDETKTKLSQAEPIVVEKTTVIEVDNNKEIY